MSTDAGIETGQDQAVQQGNKEIKELRDAHRELPGVKQERDAAKREIAFLRAGIDPEDPKFRYFVKGYDGDLSTEAITAEATAAGFIAPPQADPAAQQVLQSQQNIQQVANAQGMSPGAGAADTMVALEAAFGQGGPAGDAALSDYMASLGFRINND